MLTFKPTKCLDYYDGPTVIAGRFSDGTTGLGLWLDELDDGVRTYLLVRASARRITDVDENRVTMRQAWRHPEWPGYFLLTGCDEGPAVPRDAPHSSELSTGGYMLRHVHHGRRYKRVGGVTRLVTVDPSRVWRVKHHTHRDKYQRAAKGQARGKG